MYYPGQQIYPPPLGGIPQQNLSPPMFMSSVPVASSSNTIIIILIFVVLIGTAVGVGFYFYNKNKTNTPTVILPKVPSTNPSTNPAINPSINPATTPAGLKTTLLKTSPWIDLLECASNGGVCSTSIYSDIIYGDKTATDAYILKNKLPGSYNCTASTFKDPVSSTTKKCYSNPVTIIPTPVKLTSEVWNNILVPCSNDGGTCTTTEKGNIVYGERINNIGYVKRDQPSGSYICSTGAFGGDPSVGQTKKCYFAKSSESTTLLSTAQWNDLTKCADDSGVCSTSIYSDIIYGDKINNRGLILKNNPPGSYNCTPVKFGGDPSIGQPKSCYIRPVVLNPPAIDLTLNNGYIQAPICSNEGGNCNVGTKKGTVIYGEKINNKGYTTQVPKYDINDNTIQNIACNANNFGGDPSPYVAKQCYFRETPIDLTVENRYPDFIKCSDEGGICTTTENKDIFYADLDAKLGYKKSNQPAGNYACNSTNFGGDPSPFKDKACYIQRLKFTGFDGTWNPLNPDITTINDGDSFTYNERYDLVYGQPAGNQLYISQNNPATNGSVVCNKNLNSIGDPAPNFEQQYKKCYIKKTPVTAKSTDVLTADPWYNLDPCADEGGTCNQPYNDMGQDIIYGDKINNKSYILENRYQGNYPCENKTFGGDPSIGNIKKCYTTRKNEYSRFSQSDADSLTYCSNDNQNCNINITSDIIYGAVGARAYTRYNNPPGSYPCNSSVFGNIQEYADEEGTIPITSAKICYSRPSITRLLSTDSWKNIIESAAEGQSFITTKYSDIIFGDKVNNKGYIKKNVMPGTLISCGMPWFGNRDPSPGNNKKCYVNNAVLSKPAVDISIPPYSEAVLCAGPNEYCNLNTNSTVIYGERINNLGYVYENMTGSVLCNDTTLGDPSPGVVKNCYKTVSNTIENVNMLNTPWVNLQPVAVEGGLVTGPANKDYAIVYGSNTKGLKKNIQRSNNPVSHICNQNLVGNQDPDINIPKKCFIYTFDSGTGLMNDAPWNNLNPVANEGEQFTISNQSDIVYGEKIKNQGKLTNKLPGTYTCNVELFNNIDPNPYIKKQCYAANNIRLTSIPPWDSAPKWSNSVLCNTGPNIDPNYCQTNQYTSMAYVSDDSQKGVVLNNVPPGTYRCITEQFINDPAPSENKSCYILSSTQSNYIPILSDYIGRWRTWNDIAVYQEGLIGEPKIRQPSFFEISSDLTIKYTGYSNSGYGGTQLNDPVYQQGVFNSSNQIVTPGTSGVFYPDTFYMNGSIMTITNQNWGTINLVKLA